MAVAPLIPELALFMVLLIGHVRASGSPLGDPISGATSEQGHMSRTVVIRRKKFPGLATYEQDHEEHHWQLCAHNLVCDSSYGLHP